MRNYLLLSLVLAGVTLPAYGYLDPASGSMILQLIIGGIAGISVAVKLYWHKLRGVFGLTKNTVSDTVNDGTMNDGTVNDDNAVSHNGAAGNDDSAA
jgi:hypothetical protein